MSKNKIKEPQKCCKYCNVRTFKLNKELVCWICWLLEEYEPIK